MKPIRLIALIQVGLGVFCFVTISQAGGPLWTFAPVAGFSPTVSVSYVGSATVKYIVLNQSLKRKRLTMQPIRGVSSNGSCILQPKGASGDSCTLELNILGSNIPTEGISSGPVLCEGSTIQCYKPSAGDSLKISLSSTPSVGAGIVAAGFYNDGTNTLPLLASNINGIWDYVINGNTPTPPTGFVSGQLQSASCDQLTCITAGSYNNGTSSFPFLARSNNGGARWDYKITDSMPSLDGLNEGRLSGTSCSGLNCIAAGSYNYNVCPLVASSTDGGLTWAYVVTNSTPTQPTNWYTGHLDVASCSGLHCVAAGGYQNGQVIALPLLLSSADGGVTWAYTITGDTPTPPAGVFRNAYFVDASCSGLHCIAAGQYYNGTTNAPLLASSTDGGVTWAYTITGDTPTPPAGVFNNSSFVGASCSGLHCIAAGQYYNGTTNAPLLASSTDGGVTWAYTITGDTPTPPAGVFNNSSFVDASCSGLYCIAAGSYYNGTQNIPLLASSTDGGGTWAYVITASAPTLPVGFVSGQFSSASCRGENCIAAGSYNNGTDYFPLLAGSGDGGVTWTYSIPTPPTGIVSGGLNGTS